MYFLKGRLVQLRFFFFFFNRERRSTARALPSNTNRERLCFHVTGVETGDAAAFQAQHDVG